MYLTVLAINLLLWGIVFWWHARLEFSDRVASILFNATLCLGSTLVLLKVLLVPEGVAGICQFAILQMIAFSYLGYVEREQKKSSR